MDQSGFTGISQVFYAIRWWWFILCCDLTIGKETWVISDLINTIQWPGECVAAIKWPGIELGSYAEGF